MVAISFVLKVLRSHQLLLQMADIVHSQIAQGVVH